MTERSRIELLRARLGAPPTHVRLGIGDDCAVLDGGDEALVWTVDAAVEGVHFSRAWLSPFDIGWRATAAAISDLAAMGAEPLGALAALVLPEDVDDDMLGALADGQRAAAADASTAIIGGNLARGRELSITTTALGRAREPLPRDGARDGDVVWMAGEVGLAAAGLALLTGERHDSGPAAAAARHAFARPHARIAEGRAARAHGHAAIDVSDGLATDLSRVAAASGVRIVLAASALVSSALDEVARDLGRDPLELALFGGEDYALVVVAPSRARLEGFRRIGACEPRAEGGSQVALCAPDGSVRELPDRGWDHFG